MSIVRRGKTFHLRKRVPKRFAEIDTRGVVWLSLHTDSETVAKAKAPAAWALYLEAWEARLAGEDPDAERRFAAARELADKRGFSFLDAATVAKLPREELLARIEAVPTKKGKPDLVAAAALLGGAAPPAISVSRALDLFWDLARDRTIGKSPDQIRKWRNPRIKAVKNFIEVVGDKPIEAISADDMLTFRSWWIDRIEEEELQPGSANKDLTHFCDVLKTVNKLKKLGLAFPFADLQLKDDEQKTRPPFATSWIREHLLQPGALAGLNKEARCILLGMVNTGYRPSEGASLTRDEIRLDHAVPHILIKPGLRELKTKHSARVIPLAGVSLAAFRECPGGFPNYVDKAGLSGTINKFLRENKLMQSAEHTLYSLRHSFEDRLLEARVDERIRSDLMGHTLKRQRYGAGASLPHLAEVIQSIAL